MRKYLARSVAISAVAMLALSACGSEREGGETPAGGASGGTGGFAADSLIGVALPSKTSENWVLAGDLFTNGLKEAGFTGDVQYAGASTTVADQQNQISSMITKGAKVIIIGATDAAQLSAQVDAAHAEGIKVIAYDRLIKGTANVDYYVAFDNFKVGELQGQALLEGMKKKKPNGPYTIELFSGSSDDNNSGVFFDGAMSVLQPEIDKGNVVVGSGQTQVTQTATDGWKAENAQRRMDSLLTSTYGSKTLDGVLSPNDTLARAIITSVKGAGKPIPVVTGQDSEVESVKSIMAGEQYSTINKDTRNLVKASIDMVKALQSGAAPQVNDTTSYNNGVKVVPAYLLPPVIVTKDNAAEAYANDPTLSALTK
ncbi:substrate-binding domain-containing protein [Catenuloplanes indicus]|uniref:Multiple sugar transport system substrate-binding protein n=1 Tax=Catenuloplanes indicus TaxID=137267 RepID=A0AAE4AWB5_9ACTN|nr:sugar-binding protein [Catenuloplanes indicus]MDQ0364576.1 putative multiple sugar transport system substrate-binding protein [Catenuloplanes indicus]